MVGQINYLCSELTLILIVRFTWDAGLKTTAIELELIKDHNLHLYVEDMIRGGVSTITLRHAVANHPLLPETYNPELPHEFLQYYDANNLVSVHISLLLFVAL